MLRQYRLRGDASTIIMTAYSALDVGARYESDKSFYAHIGTLETIEDMGGVIVARVTAKGRVVPVQSGTKKDKSKPKEKIYKRERTIRVEFNF